ncbi:MAG: undecaprenyl-phosphate glucose phosphotransferase [Clostridia bacterium]|nr:undecaprenyl-phosphate glucose phosphotransferase [Clostridia bacterium]
MIKKNQGFLNFLNAFSDAALILISYFVSLGIRFEVLNGYSGNPLRDSRFAIVAVLYSIGIVITYAAAHLYKPKRLKRVGIDNIRVFIINGIGSFILMAFFFIFRLLDVSRLTIFIFWMLSSVFVSVKRTTVFAVLRYFRSKGYNLKHVVVVGNGRLAQQYIRSIRANTQLGIRVDGYVSGVPKKEMGVPLGSYEELGEIIQNGSYDGIIVALEPHEIRFMPSVLGIADKEGIHVEMIPFYNDYYPMYPTVETIDNIKLFNLRATPMDNIVSVIIKRSFDLIGSLLLIIITSPLMLVIAIGVKLSSPGPIIFKQERIGKDKKPFMMLKFRSMRMNSSEDTGWSTDRDERRTKFGSFIRKYSLDEFPQFFNVLVGQMSFVGPRPEVPFHVNHYKEEIPRYLIRQQVRPGITGWAQINGLRGDTSIRERVEYDLWYIDNWSAGLDLKIIWRTIFGGMVNKEVIM